MLRADYLAIVEVESREALAAALVRLMHSAGFDRMSCGVIVDRESGRFDLEFLDNAPDGYRAAFEDPALGKRDPVMQYIKRHSLPLVWDRATYALAGQDALWENQASFGYSTGISLAMHLPCGRHFTFGLERDQSLPRDAAELSRMVADVQLLAVYAQDAAFRLMMPAAWIAESPRLTRRELECLRWTMEGKTAWELSRILGISEHTAVRHIFNASRKLGCATKLQAAIRALRLGLIN